MSMRPWTFKEDRRALEMKRENYTHEFIGQRLNRTEQAIRNRLRWLSMNEDERAHVRYVKNHKRYGKRRLPSPRSKIWTAQETELAEKLVAEKASDQVCQSLLGRTRQACKDRLSRVVNKQNGISSAVNHYVSGYSVKVPPEVLHDRERRLMAPRSLTAILMGDPETGRVRL